MDARHTLREQLCGPSGNWRCTDSSGRESLRRAASLCSGAGVLRVTLIMPALLPSAAAARSATCAARHALSGPVCFSASSSPGMVLRGAMGHAERLLAVQMLRLGHMHSMRGNLIPTRCHAANVQAKQHARQACCWRACDTEARR
jgi:hypothetical protein